MRFEYDTYDIDVYSLCESVYYSCNNDEYDYVLECVNDWIYNGYNDNILLEDIVLNEISSDKIYKVLADKFVKTFPEYASSREDFYNKVGYKPADDGTMQFWDKGDKEWRPFINYDDDDYHFYDNDQNYAGEMRRVFKKGNAAKDKRLESFLRYANRLLSINKNRNYLRGASQEFYPDLQEPGKPIRIQLNALKDKAKENATLYNSNALAEIIDNAELGLSNEDKVRLRKYFRDRRYDGYTSPKGSVYPAFDKRRSHDRKVETNTQQQETQSKQKKPSQTPPKSNPILLNAQKKKDESQANMQKIVDNISQTSQQQEPPLKPGTAATDQSGRKVETNTQQQETQSNTPPKSNTPVVTSNGNNQSRLSRATDWVKNNKVKGGLGVVAAGAAIGGSIYAYKRFKNRPKSVIAKRIQALRGIYHKFMINAQRNPKKANLFKRVAAKILSVIDKLLHYLQNKADGR